LGRICLGDGVADANAGAKCRPAFPMAGLCAGSARNDSGADGVLCKAESIGGGTWQIFQQSGCGKVELKYVSNSLSERCQARDHWQCPQCVYGGGHIGGIVGGELGGTTGNVCMEGGISVESLVESLEAQQISSSADGGARAFGLPADSRVLSHSVWIVHLRMSYCWARSAWCAIVPASSRSLLVIVPEGLE
jgi:hypothetical protein